MLGSETLEVAIGMAFLFLTASLVCTALKEWLEGIFKWRAMDLERALRNLLDDPKGTQLAELLRQPQLASLFSGQYDPAQLRSSWLTPGGPLHVRLSRRRNLPSYIPSAQFAAALIDQVARGSLPTAAAAAGVTTTGATTAPRALPTAATAPVPPTATAAATARPAATPMTVEALLQALTARAAAGAVSPHLERAVLSAVDQAGGDLREVRRNVERWFDGAMDRASGWYRRRTQAIQFALGFAIAAALNLDALHVMRRLTVDKTFRAVVVQQAGAAASAPSGTDDGRTPVERMRDVRGELETLGMPIGWEAVSPAPARPSPHPVGVALRDTWPWQVPLLPQQLCVLPQGGVGARPADAAGAAVAVGAASMAETAVTAGTTETATTAAASASPAGTCLPRDVGALDAARVLLGWLATAFAVMLGAPFWFDVLNKFMVVRSTVKPHEKSPEESSEDRQAARPAPAAPPAGPPAAS